MPARIPLVLTLIAAAVAPLTASAQSDLIAFRGPMTTAPAAASLAPYEGVYSASGGTLELVERDGALRILVSGAPVAAALIPLASVSDELNARTHALLSAWIDGDTMALAASVASHRQPEATTDLTAFRSALTGRIGDMTRAEVIGTFRQTNGRQATLARVHFERGAQWISLVWTETDELATVKRGLSPVVVGTAYPTDFDTFESAGMPLTFDRDTTGQVRTLTVGGSVQAAR